MTMIWKSQHARIVTTMGEINLLADPTTAGEVDLIAYPRTVVEVHLLTYPTTVGDVDLLAGSMSGPIITAV